MIYTPGLINAPKFVKNNTPLCACISGLDVLESAAAIKIQSTWRGHTTRVEVKKEKKHLLSYALFEKAIPYIAYYNPRFGRGKHITQCIFC